VPHELGDGDDVDATTCPGPSAKRSAAGPPPSPNAPSSCLAHDPEINAIVSNLITGWTTTASHWPEAGQ
jgi:hypothetical protein